MSSGRSLAIWHFDGLAIGCELTIDSFLEGYEVDWYADDADKADERGFKKLRYTIINDKLKSAFVRLVRVVRVSIHSLLF